MFWVNKLSIDLHIKDSIWSFDQVHTANSFCLQFNWDTPNIRKVVSDYTKGIVLRGYNNQDFSKLDIVKKGNFTGNSKNLIENYISIGKELSFDLNLEVGDKISIIESRPYSKIKNSKLLEKINDSSSNRTICCR